MPWRIRKLKGGRLRVKSPSRTRTFKSKAKFKRWKKYVLALEHGFKPRKRH